MHLEIIHHFLYKYTNNVLLEPHIMYAYPKKSSLLKLLSFDMDVFPKPSNVVKNLDISDNIQHILYFFEPTQVLEIKVKSIIELSQFNPFSFLYLPETTHLLPFEYAQNEMLMLSPYLQKTQVTTLIEQQARLLASQAHWNTSDFLLQLNQYINSFQYEARLEGDPYSPEKTLIQKKGSCRDFSVLFIVMARALGVASRFVSGYYYTNQSQEQTLHAWVEVYLPGGGWRGYDPTQNCLVSGNHIPLGTSAYPQMVAPLMGTYRGMSKAIFEANVSIKEIDIKESAFFFENI
ncbi:MAG: transglutaminase family protein [Pseudarcicella sp.]|nr:transglutaminase family protein [Pseudarcicella sp.]MBP6409666.1 transglutaminase family protein [Pseudarcicella sp.]